MQLVEIVSRIDIKIVPLVEVQVSKVSGGSIAGHKLISWVDANHIMHNTLMLWLRRRKKRAGLIDEPKAK